MESLTAETRAELRRLIDLRRREQARTLGKAPRRYTRCKTEEERLERTRAKWRRYYWRNRDSRLEAQRRRDAVAA